MEEEEDERSKMKGTVEVHAGTHKGVGVLSAET